MKVIEKKAPTIMFRDVKPGQVFRTNDLGYMMRIEEIQAYDEDEDEQVWVNVVSLRDGSLTAVLDTESVEWIKDCELVIY